MKHHHLVAFLIMLGSASSGFAADEAVPPVQHVGEPAALEPGWADYNTGLERLRAFDLEQATASFAAAARRSSQNIDYATAQALSLLLQQRFVDGRGVIDRALATGRPTPMARAIRAFAAALNGDRAGMLTYPRPQTDFEWMISRIGESLVATQARYRMPVNEAVRQFPKIAADFAQLHLANGGADNVLLARGLQRRLDKNYGAAVADLAEYLGRHPEDATVRWYMEPR